eukprot:CAMPEP_0179454576 /NCGR_PEP_ID=MMETSP0799-20121207/38424_1 /TAXON_ID=46947 /ORGANISM="Geminigera cryophila, Strain CCMP2564" /LENGTH=87 /DNA_ID=CAMNT_0021252561 /DNA_START=29 /DNA_END=291 /DNA_ORIENTATION=-
MSQFPEGLFNSGVEQGPLSASQTLRMEYEIMYMGNKESASSLDNIGVDYAVQNAVRSNVHNIKSQSPVPGSTSTAPAIPRGAIAIYM